MVFEKSAENLDTLLQASSLVQSLPGRGHQSKPVSYVEFIPFTEVFSTSLGGITRRICSQRTTTQPIVRVQVGKEARTQGLPENRPLPSLPCFCVLNKVRMSDTVEARAQN